MNSAVYVNVGSLKTSEIWPCLGGCRAEDCVVVPERTKRASYQARLDVGRVTADGRRAAGGDAGRHSAPKGLDGPIMDKVQRRSAVLGENSIPRSVQYHPCKGSGERDVWKEIALVIASNFDFLVKGAAVGASEGSHGPADGQGLVDVGKKMCSEGFVSIRSCRLDLAQELFEKLDGIWPKGRQVCDKAAILPETQLGVDPIVRIGCKLGEKRQAAKQEDQEHPDDGSLFHKIGMYHSGGRDVSSMQLFRALYRCLPSDRTGLRWTKPRPWPYPHPEGMR